MYLLSHNTPTHVYPHISIYTPLYLYKFCIYAYISGGGSCVNRSHASKAVRAGGGGQLLLAPGTDLFRPSPDAKDACSGDFVSRLSNRPYRAYYDLLWWLKGDTKWTY